VAGIGIRVLLADDHTILRTAICALLAREPDIEVVADVDCGSEAVRLAKELVPDVVVMDISMPGIDGIEATRQLVAAVPGAKVLALSTHMERLILLKMLEAGASGYVSKSAGGHEFTQAIRAVAKNGTYFSAEIAASIFESMRRKVPKQEVRGQRLSPRENEVLALLAGGATSAKIAAEMKIALGTVIMHRRNLSRKLGLRSVAELTKYAIREGLTSA
jgi:two-component system NarL family response regulator